MKRRHRPSSTSSSNAASGRISVGRVIVATWEPHEKTVLETIRDCGLELQVIFNKGAVMVLPAGVNKATGLRAALAELNLSPHNAVGVGDAENDHAFLSICECSVAVANALPAVKAKADIVTFADHGAGVTELIDEMLADDLASRESGPLARHDIPLGKNAAGQADRLVAVPRERARRRHLGRRQVHCRSRARRAAARGELQLLHHRSRRRLRQRRVGSRARQSRACADGR